MCSRCMRCAGVVPLHYAQMHCSAEQKIDFKNNTDLYLSLNCKYSKDRRVLVEMQVFTVSHHQ